MHSHRPEIVNVQTANLEFLGAGLFGPPRDKSEHHAGWTGDAYKFGVYAHLSRHSRHDVVILRTGGGGFYGYLDVSLSAAEMWRHLCATCTPEMLWNICSCVVHTHDLARGKGRQEIMNIFAEGRLKKRRRQGRIQVYVETRIVESTPPQKL